MIIIMIKKPNLPLYSCKHGPLACRRRRMSYPHCQR